MPRHDVQCTLCGEILRDHFLSPWPDLPLHGDGGELVILWHSASSHSATVHPSERTVVWQAPDGKISYPPRNDSIMPQRYADRGFKRVEFEHLRDVERFEKEHRVINEKAWYNSGNGVD